MSPETPPAIASFPAAIGHDPGTLEHCPGPILWNALTAPGWLWVVGFDHEPANYFLRLFTENYTLELTIDAPIRSWLGWARFIPRT